MSKMTEMLSDVKKAAWVEFYLAQAQITREIDRRMTAAGVVGMEVYDVLLNLEDAPDSRLRMNELADRVTYSRSGITRLVDRLEKEGLVARVACPSDRRAMHCQLTAHGRSERERAWPVYAAEIEALFGRHLSDEDAKTIVRLFGPLRICPVDQP